MLSKRFLLRLVKEGHVRGWDDPRMPTISGMRRRGYPAEGIRELRGHDRGRQGRRPGRGRPAGVRGAGRAQPAGTASLWCPAAAQGGHRELPGGTGGGDRRHQQSRGPVSGHAQGVVRAGALDRARRLHGGPAQRSSSGWRRAARCACGPPTSSPAPRSSRMRRERSSSSAARTTRPRAAETRRMADDPRRPCTGSRPRMRCPPRCACTSICSRAPIRARTGT